MATVTVTSAASGATFSGTGTAPCNIASSWFTANVYTVAIELDHHDLPDVCRGPVTADKYMYPPFNLTKPKAVSRVQNTDGELTRRTFTGTPGKSLLTGTVDSSGSTPSNALDDALIIYLTSTDINGDYSQEILAHAPYTNPPDVGLYFGAFGKYLGAGTANAFATSWTAPSYDLYLFYLNFDYSGVTFNTKFSIGIDDASLISIFGTNCIGVQLSYSGSFSITPTYKATGEISVNGRVRPSIDRPYTFGQKGTSQDDWRIIPCSGGSVITGDFLSPCGQCVFKDMHGSGDWSWCANGMSEDVVFYDPAGTLGSNYTIRAYYINSAGKIINPSGTTILSTWHPESAFPYGRGQANGWLSFTISPPAKAVAYKMTYEDTVLSPGVESSVAYPFVGYNLRKPSHYAADYGDYVPGNCMVTTISESDMP